MGTISESPNKSDTLSTAIQGQVAVSTTAIELKVGGSALTGRQMIHIINDSNNTIYIGYDNTVTTSGTTRGEKLVKDATLTFMLTENQSVWAIAASGTNNILVAEFS